MRPPLHVGCKIDGCDGKHLARGFCNLHYKRVVVRNTPEPQADRRTVNPADRIEDCRWMADHGETLSGAARRIGIGRSALDAWLRNHDPETRDVLASREAWPSESRATFHGVAS